MEEQVAADLNHLVHPCDVRIQINLFACEKRKTKTKKPKREREIFMKGTLFYFRNFDHAINLTPRLGGIAMPNKNAGSATL